MARPQYVVAAARVTGDISIQANAVALGYQRADWWTDHQGSRVVFFRLAPGLCGLAAGWIDQREHRVQRPEVLAERHRLNLPTPADRVVRRPRSVRHHGSRCRPDSSARDDGETVRAGMDLEC